MSEKVAYVYEAAGGNTVLFAFGPEGPRVLELRALDEMKDVTNPITPNDLADAAEKCGYKVARWRFLPNNKNGEVVRVYPGGVEEHELWRPDDIVFLAAFTVRDAS